MAATPSSTGATVRFDEELNTSHFESDVASSSSQDEQQQRYHQKDDCVLAICYNKGVMGAAVYDTGTACITLFPDFREADSLEFTKQLISVRCGAALLSFSFCSTYFC
jgi:hypothetical protein